MPPLEEREEFSLDGVTYEAINHLSAHAIHNRFASLAVFVDDAVMLSGQSLRARMRRLNRSKSA